MVKCSTLKVLLTMRFLFGFYILLDELQITKCAFFWKTLMRSRARSSSSYKGLKMMLQISFSFWFIELAWMLKHHIFENTNSFYSVKWITWPWTEAYFHFYSLHLMNQFCFYLETMSQTSKHPDSTLSFLTNLCQIIRNLQPDLL